MGIFKRLSIASIAFVFAISLSSCTPNTETITVGADEFSEKVDNVEEHDDEILSSSSSAKKVATSSSKNLSSSSSKKVESSTSKSSQKDNEDSDSSNSKLSSSSEKRGTSSSSQVASSSSAKKKIIPGMEDDDSIESSNSKAPSSSENAKAGSSDDKASANSSDDETTASSSDDAAKISSSSAKGNNKDTTVVMDENKRDSTMEKIDDDEQKDIEEKIEKGDSSITKIDTLIIDNEDLKDDDSEYLCKAPDGSWYKLTANKFQKFWMDVWDFIVWVFTGHRYYDFTKICDEIYVRHI